MTALSSNWKKLQAKLSAGSQPSAPRKRPRDPDQDSLPRPRRPRVESNGSTSTEGPLRRIRMGAVQSSAKEDKVVQGHASPSLSLWANENEISAEALAEAYGLGLNNNSMSTAADKDKVNQGLADNVDIGKYVAIDCEMVGVGAGGYESSLARVSIVDFHGRQVYDSFVKQREHVTDWRTPVSGIGQKEMRFARSFEEVQRQVHQIMEGRIVIGHDIKHDLDALKLSHPVRDIRDTSRHAAFRKHGHGRKPGLRVLAQQLLDIDIQTGAHSSIEDARVTMLLFRKDKSGFDVHHAAQYAAKPSTGNGRQKQSNKTKKRRP